MTDPLTVTQAAALLHLITRRVRRLIHAGLLPARRFNSHWLIESEAVRNLKRRPAGRPFKSASPSPG